MPEDVELERRRAMQQELDRLKTRLEVSLEEHIDRMIVEAIAAAERITEKGA